MSFGVGRAHLRFGLQKGLVQKAFWSSPFCAEDGGQYDIGHECVVTGRDAFSIRSFILTTAEAPR